MTTRLVVRRPFKNMFSPSIGRVQLSAKRAYMVVGRSRVSDKGGMGRGRLVQHGHPPFASGALYSVLGTWRQAVPPQRICEYGGGFSAKADVDF